MVVVVVVLMHDRVTMNQSAALAAATMRNVTQAKLTRITTMAHCQSKRTSSVILDITCDMNTWHI